MADDTTLTDPENATVYVEKTDPQARQRGGRRDVPGWGADLDPADRPAFPKERTPPRLEIPHSHDLPHQQHRHDVEVFHSTERPGLTPVWGTSSPPRGMSGAIRRYAYHFSENDLRRWFILMLADRVDVGEGIFEDLAHGHVPNLWKEMGLASEWKHDRAALVKKLLIASALAGLAIYLLRRDRDD